MPSSPLARRSLAGALGSCSELLISIALTASIRPMNATGLREVLHRVVNTCRSAIAADDSRHFSECGALATNSAWNLPRVSWPAAAKTTAPRGAVLCLSTPAHLVTQKT
jgi:hypothetical protein